MNLELFASSYSIYRLPAIPSSRAAAFDQLLQATLKVAESEFLTFSRTPSEWSWIAPSSQGAAIRNLAAALNVSEELKMESEYFCFCVAEELDFNAIGIIAQLSQLFAQAEFPILTVSTFDTDYFLIGKDHWPGALILLENNGYVVSRIDHNGRS
ncbi:MAG: ACT domain-containing protein [Planctomycetota bacterium]